MNFVSSEVYLVAETSLKVPVGAPSLDDYLDGLGVPEWDTDAVSDGEKLIEVGGRMCYRSFSPGLNKNVTKVREGNLDYITNVISHGHGSILEHCSMTFIFQNVSRVFTHELVRHRIGSFSQESLRYVALDNIPFVNPKWFVSMMREEDREPFLYDITRVMGEVEWFIDKWTRHLILGFYPQGFAWKKLVTSTLRRVAPMGLGTSIMYTTNLRNLRHVLNLRTNEHAEGEIREVFDQVGLMAKTYYPAVFADFERKDDGSWVPQFEKV